MTHSTSDLPAGGAAGFERVPVRAAEIGAGFTVARALPSARRRTVGAWCFLDHAGPVKFAPGGGMKVGPHPHIGLQTFTWMIDGEVLHRDSLGSEQLIRPGEVNLMTAGRGIAHSEESIDGTGGALHAAQLWIALPDAQRHCEPAFSHHPVLPALDAGGFRITVLVGDAFGLHAPPRVYSAPVGLDFVAQHGARSVLALDPGFEHALLCLSGRASVDGTPLDPEALLYVPPGRSGLKLAADPGCRLLLIGGAPLAAPPLIWWNFVACTADEIMAAADDWNAGRRFGAVTGTALARIAAPEVKSLKLRPERGR